MKPSELKKYEKILQERRRDLLGRVSQLENSALRDNRQDFSVDHMADAGSDSYDQDFTLGLMEAEQQEVRDIMAAIERIQEGTFGVCETCGQPLAKPRLEAIPYARLCVECKTKEEREEG
jgi:RNA polymerase-binding protein DksA